MSSVRIAHITDLHCDGTDGWMKNFDYVVRCLVKEKPHIIVVTGDLVESTDKKYFQSVSKALSDLYNRILEVHDRYPLFMLTVPGNHDYKKKGLIPSFGKGKLFYSFFEELQFPSSKNWEDIALEIYNEYNVALFPFDSNILPTFAHTAQGHVNEPEKHFNIFRDKYTKAGADLNRCVKIALLHHHPLPLPSTMSDEHKEPFMILRNAYQFLSSAQKHNIDIILHGHRHMSGVTEYKSKVRNHSTILVSACGSTADLKTEKREIKILDIDESRSISGKTYKADNTNPVFEVDLGLSYELIGYSEVRKAKSLYLSSRSSKAAISSSIAKTKVATIQDDGNAVVVITHEGIRWTDNCKEDEMFLMEYMRADVGRISYGWTKFVEESTAESQSGKYWKHPDSEEFTRARSCKYEILDHKAKPVARISNEKDAFCEIKYRLYNGYALATEDHEESYGDWEENRREETCTIEANFPTEVLELVVKFPSKEAFPAREYIYLDAAERLNPEEEKELTIMRRKYDVNEAESRFLEKKHAIRYRPEIREIVVVIRYPQPELLYVLRWGLDARKNSAVISYSEKQVVSKLQDDLLNNLSTKSQLFYKKVSDRLGEVFDGDDIEILLLGLDPEESNLVVSHGPKRFSKASKVCTGRGVAGYAFRTRKVTYWGKPSQAEYREDDMPCMEPEQIIPDFDPVSVLALPLTYPKIDPEKGLTNDGAGETKRFPVCGVLVIVAGSESKKLKNFCPRPKARRGNDEVNRERLEAIQALYLIVWSELLETYGDILGN